MPTFPVFSDINALHERTGFAEKTHVPGIHILDMADAGPLFVRAMPPYRQTFYQFGFQTVLRSTEFSLQTHRISTAQNLLYGVAPHQLMSWAVQEQNYGYILYVQPDFLPPLPRPLDDEFPFLRLSETTLIEVTEPDALNILADLTALRAVFVAREPHQSAMLQHLTVTFLYRCKGIYEAVRPQTEPQPKANQIAGRFGQLMQKYFLEHRTLDFYADQLGLTPNHLSAVVRAATGASPKQLLNERLAQEAKNLLTYTTADVSEIAYQLGFGEMTHFGRFFRNQTGQSPTAFRAGL